jgi:hypothetical protein
VLHRQTAWLASAIFSDEEFSAAGSNEPFASRVSKTEPKQPGEEIFTVAVASRREVPSPEALISLGALFEVSWWQEQVQAAGAKGHELALVDLERADAARAEADAARAEADAAREQADRDLMLARKRAAVARREATTARKNSLESAKRLLEIEENLAQSKARIFALEAALAERAAVADEMHDRVLRADRVMTAMKTSVSWRVTAPLRALKRRR